MAMYVMEEMPDIHGTDKAPGTEHGFRRLIFRAIHCIR